VWSKSVASRDVGPVAGPLALLESSSVVGCIVLTADGSIRDANTLATRWLTGGAGGSPESLGFEEWLPRPADRAAVGRAFESGGARQIELELGLASGDRLPVVGDLIPLGEPGRKACLGVFRDATAGRHLKAGMERSARLEALGSLTSGVAHDFNNLLTILIGNLALAAEEAREQPKLFAKLKAARDAARRGGDLIQQLLSFARQEPVASRLINPARVISGVAPLIQRALGGRIKLELELDESVDAIQGNSAQLESVIVNLAVNARDAIESTGHVRLAVSADGGDAEAKPGRGQGRYLCIEVSDDGSGIPADVVDRVFEPFFTTKAEGRGSGLGLSMVKAYAEQFGGKTELLSQPGQGTTVRLWFQTSSGAIDESAAMTMPMAVLPTGDELVALLIADETLSGMLQQVLTALGYRCRIVTDLGAASRLLKDLTPELVVSDGFDVRLLTEAQPEAARSRVLMLGGVDETGAGQAFPVLRKPFSLPDLATAVRETLDAGPGTKPADAL